LDLIPFFLQLYSCTVQLYFCTFKVPTHTIQGVLATIGIAYILGS